MARVPLIDPDDHPELAELAERLRGRRTVFVVAPRLSTLRSADRIVVLENGRVAQNGTHDELMKLSGYYRELVSLQVEPRAV